MPAISVSFDTIPFQTGLEAAYRDQFPFAIARALTLTAKNAQSRIQAIIPKRFVSRNKWLERGIRITPATKTKLWVEVGSIDDIFVGHVEGERRTKKGQRTVPTYNVRPSPSTKIPKSKTPHRLIHKPGQRKPFFTTFKSGRKVLAQRKGKRRLPIKVLYHFPSSVEIKPRLSLEDIVRGTVDDKWVGYMAESLDKALATSKR